MKRIGEYVIKELIGIGAYGKVYKGYSKNGEECAIKIIPKKNLPRKLFKYIENEVKILQEFDNEKIVKLKGKIESENNYYIILEYCNNGDLEHYLKLKGGKVTELETRGLIRKIVQCLDLLYKKRILHRDIKLANIFLHCVGADSTPLIKLGDFGLAQLAANSDNSKSFSDEYAVRSAVGTTTNMAPEVLQQKRYSFKADIWSLGTILYELLFGHYMFEAENREELIQKVLKGEYRIPSDAQISIECLEFLTCCLQDDPEKRISWEDLLNHSFILTDNYTKLHFDQLQSLNPSIEISGNSAIFSSKAKYGFKSNARGRSNSNQLMRKRSKSKIETFREKIAERVLKNSCKFIENTISNIYISIIP